MADAIADQNFVRSKLAVLNTDTVQGTNLVNIKINSSNGGIKVNVVDTISFTMVPLAPEDANYNKVWLAQGADGLTYPLVANADGEILVDM